MPIHREKQYHLQRNEIPITIQSIGSFIMTPPQHNLGG